MRNNVKTRVEGIGMPRSLRIGIMYRLGNYIHRQPGREDEKVSENRIKYVRKMQRLRTAFMLPPAVHLTYLALRFTSTCPPLPTFGRPYNGQRTPSDPFTITFSSMQKWLGKESEASISSLDEAALSHASSVWLAGPSPTRVMGGLAVACVRRKRRR